ncbi:acyloxyacyl hydrolase [Comamonas endophytica]|uniref:Acyloxyacyl hydrolase n=1 Tax=Comamonas endophytica TaxID=2949090 RepID=A0ABY6GEU9_9BURK|nr:MULTISPECIES: acyloxyacyl hydrolase [unclassified Acidovorax]MCD2512439.1 acyloxyacyl hydrolase [Acidovorax sp. D4N7]UYG53190.1 acyloxyacyl hydrolase [Acidovorax sp. 5MLIR]
MRLKNFRRFVFTWTTGTALGLVSLGALAQGAPVFNDHSPSWYVQGAVAENDAYSASLGATLPWRQWSYALGSGQITGHWDLFASHWSSRMANDDRQRSYVFGVLPTLRWRGDQGRSAWFAQVGTGLALATKRYQSHEKHFSTRYNFGTHLAVGANFGAQREHEIMLRIEHYSNAGIKHPNPGEDFLQLRYARRF